MFAVNIEVICYINFFPNVNLSVEGLSSIIISAVSSYKIGTVANIDDVAYIDDSISAVSLFSHMDLQLVLSQSRIFWTFISILEPFQTIFK